MVEVEAEALRMLVGVLDDIDLNVGRASNALRFLAELHERGLDVDDCGETEGFSDCLALVGQMLSPERWAMMGAAGELVRTMARKGGVL